jgi:hypothetical protein
VRRKKSAARKKPAQVGELWKQARFHRAGVFNLYGKQPVKGWAQRLDLLGNLADWALTAAKKWPGPSRKKPGELLPARLWF